VAHLIRNLGGKSSAYARFTTPKHLSRGTVGARDLAKGCGDFGLSIDLHYSTLEIVWKKEVRNRELPNVCQAATRSKPAPQAAKTFSCTAIKEKPEVVSQANSDARQYSLTAFFSTLVSLVKISIMIGDRHEAKQPY
jgi:hypothetical protein